MPGETFLTLVLADGAPALAEAHDELYPLRVREGIPLSLTLLAPFVPRDELTAEHVDTLRSFFAARRPLDFELVRLDEFPGLVVYAVPEPDDELRATMRALWALYPEYPPYGRPGSDPPPHATLAQLGDDPAAVRAAAERRVEGLLPVRCVAGEASLFEEFEPDRCRVRETFPLGA
jgi:2'-5' RNA ligase superfamily protein